jgi:hypothetical protein
VIDNYAQCLLSLICRHRAILDNRKALFAATHIIPCGWMDELFRDMAAYRLDVLKLDKFFESLEVAMQEGDMERFSQESSSMKKYLHFRDNPGSKVLQGRCYYRLQRLISRAGILAADCPDDRKEALTAFAIQLAVRQIDLARNYKGKSRSRAIRQRLKAAEEILLPWVIPGRRRISWRP